MTCLCNAYSQRVPADTGELSALACRPQWPFGLRPPQRRAVRRTKHQLATEVSVRFELKRAEESPTDFKKRVNEAALDEDEEKPKVDEDHGWVFGPKCLNRGSLHSDIWHGTAQELAARGVIAIFLVGGWWKDQPKHDRSANGVRYSLLVSIETPPTDVDIWTPVAQEVGIVTQITI